MALEEESIAAGLFSPLFIRLTSQLQPCFSLLPCVPFLSPKARVVEERIEKRKHFRLAPQKNIGSFSSALTSASMTPQPPLLPSSQSPQLESQPKLELFDCSLPFIGAPSTVKQSIEEWFGVSLAILLSVNGKTEEKNKKDTVLAEGNINVIPTERLRSLTDVIADPSIVPVPSHRLRFFRNNQKGGKKTPQNEPSAHNLSSKSKDICTNASP